MNLLGIETSCDETAIAIVKDGTHELAHCLSSQIKWHKQFGGVVPELASRMHVEKIHVLLNQVLDQAQLTLADIDGIAVTQGPGLEGSLLVGMAMAKALATILEKPLVGVHHVLAHVYSAYLNDRAPVFPYIAAIVSGGHTELILLRDHRHFERIGKTRDDAAGEAFDKVARLLGLPYPGGPEIEKAGLSGSETRFKLPLPLISEGFDFSFSGLKTAVLHLVQTLQSEGPLPVADIAASFQYTVGEILGRKTLKACQAHGISQVVFCGGVSANQSLRRQISTLLSHAGIETFVPPIRLSTDNASMIAARGYFQFQDFGANDPSSLLVRPSWPLCS